MVKYARYENDSNQKTNLYQQIITGLLFLSETYLYNSHSLASLPIREYITYIQSIAM